MEWATTSEVIKQIKKELTGHPDPPIQFLGIPTVNNFAARKTPGLENRETWGTG